jgi:hypothetical protein
MVEATTASPPPSNSFVPWNMCFHEPVFQVATTCV